MEPEAKVVVVEVVEVVGGGTGIGPVTNTLDVR